MTHRFLSTLTSSFVVVIMAVSSLWLYFTWTHEIWWGAKSALILLACSFLYWALWFWSALQVHLARKKDKEWQTRDGLRKKLLKDLKDEERASKRQAKADRKIWKERRKEIIRELRDEKG